MFGPFFDRPLAVICERGKPKSEDLAKAMLAGWGGDEAGLILREPAGLPAQAYALAFVGLRPETAKLLRQAHFERRDFLTIDNGYFRPYKEGGYFRVTANAMQAQGSVSAPTPEAFARWDRLGIEIEPWRFDDGPILIVLQSAAWYPMVLGINREDWLRDVLNTLEAATTRPIVIREKPLKGVPVATTFEHDLQDAHAVVALSSRCLLEALVRGVPVFPVGEHPTMAMSGSLSEIDRPPWWPAVRRLFCANLAAAQWTRDEIAAGDAYRVLKDAGLPPHRNLA